MKEKWKDEKRKEKEILVKTNNKEQHGMTLQSTMSEITFTESTSGEHIMGQENSLKEIQDV